MYILVKYEWKEFIRNIKVAQNIIGDNSHHLLSMQSNHRK